MSDRSRSERDGEVEPAPSRHEGDHSQPPADENPFAGARELCYATSRKWGVKTYLQKTSRSELAGRSSLSRLAHELHPFRSESSLNPPRQLWLNTPSDASEQEAHRVSSQVLGAPRGSCACGGGCSHCRGRSWSRTSQPIVRQASSDHGQVAPAGVQDALGNSTGQPLDASTRAFMEPRFGHDFSRVRVHTDAAAASASRNLSASAFTLGSSIFFNADRYEPHRLSGLGLIAHELTHVMQQSGDPSRPIIQRSLIPYQQITWADFKGAPPAKHDPREGAGINNPFAPIDYHFKGDKPHDSGKSCGPKRKQLTNFEAPYHVEDADLDTQPAAMMDQEQSWAIGRYKGDGSALCNTKTGSDKALFATCMSDEVKERNRLLKHEQGHFDIANALALNARADIKSLAHPVTGKGCGLDVAQDDAAAQYGKVDDAMRARATSWAKLKDTVEDLYDTGTDHGGDAAKQKGWENEISGGLKKFQPPPVPAATTPATATPPPATAPDVKSTPPPQKKK
jgi:hypothetical protein